MAEAFARSSGDWLTIDSAMTSSPIISTRRSSRSASTLTVSRTWTDAAAACRLLGAQGVGDDLWVGGVVADQHFAQVDFAAALLLLGKGLFDFLAIDQALADQNVAEALVGVRSQFAHGSPGGGQTGQRRRRAAERRAWATSARGPGSGRSPERSAQRIDHPLEAVGGFEDDIDHRSFEREGSLAGAVEQAFSLVGERAEIVRARNPATPLMVWKARKTELIASMSACSTSSVRSAVSAFSRCSSASAMNSPSRLGSAESGSPPAWGADGPVRPRWRAMRRVRPRRPASARRAARA